MRLFLAAILGSVSLATSAGEYFGGAGHSKSEACEAAEAKANKHAWEHGTCYTPCDKCELYKNQPGRWQCRSISNNHQTSSCSGKIEPKNPNPITEKPCNGGISVGWQPATPAPDRARLTVQNQGDGQCRAYIEI